MAYEPWTCPCGSTNTVVHYVCNNCGYHWEMTEPPLDPDGRPGKEVCPDSLVAAEWDGSAGCNQPTPPSTGYCNDCYAVTQF
ncbi:MAG: hypothetical protein R6X13_12675 [bacterium]